MNLELVVARYRERVDWVRNLPAAVRVTIADKGGDLDPESVPRAEVRTLANVGFEAHTYLDHLVRRYDSLAPLTLFCQGHPFDHAPDLHRVVRALAGGAGSPPPPPDGFRWLGFLIDSDDPRGLRLFVNWSKNHDRRELSLDRFHRELFGEPAPEVVYFYPGAQFVVSAERVRARPRDFYARALALSETFPDAGHCLERLWDRVFGVRGVDPALLGGEPCRYFKPIRRLATSAGEKREGGDEPEPDRSLTTASTAPSNAQEERPRLQDVQDSRTCPS